MFARLPRQKPQGQSRPNLLSSARNPLASLVTVSDESVSNFTVVIAALLVVVLVRQIQLSHVLWNASTADDAFWNNFWAGNSTLGGRMQFLTNIWISSPLFVDKRICFQFLSLRFFCCCLFYVFLLCWAVIGLGSGDAWDMFKRRSWSLGREKRKHQNKGLLSTVFSPFPLFTIIFVFYNISL